MDEKMINRMDDISLPPSDFITLMFERTDENDSYRCSPFHLHKFKGEKQFEKASSSYRN